MEKQTSNFNFIIITEKEIKDQVSGKFYYEVSNVIRISEKNERDAFKRVLHMFKNSGRTSPDKVKIYREGYGFIKYITRFRKR